MDYKYPRFRKFARKSAQIIWWTISGELIQKIKSNKIHLLDKPHFAPLFNDTAIGVPFRYEIDMPAVSPRLVVICHMFYIEMMDEFKLYLSKIPFEYGLCISTDTAEKKNELIKSLKDWHTGKLDIRITPNRGRDIAPKLVLFKDIYKDYEYVLHLHSKLSPYGSAFINWRSYLLNTLLGSEEVVNSVFEIFNKNQRIGIIAPQHFEAVRMSIGWGYNFNLARKVARRLKIKLNIRNYLDFPSGSMFWARTSALRPVLEAGLTFRDFPFENKQEDGTMAHAIERLYFHICNKAGFDWIKIAQKELLKSNDGRVIPIQQESDLHQYFEQHIIKMNELGNADYLEQLYQNIYRSSEYTNQLKYPDFKQELKKLEQDKRSLIDFNETFYRQMYPDVAHMIYLKIFPSGYIHFILFGKNENRIWSTHALASKYNLEAKIGSGLYAPVLHKDFKSYSFALDHYLPSPVPWLLILFKHLEEDLFFAGYAAFFNDFKYAFSLFERVTIAVEHYEFDANIARKYIPTIEVTHSSQITGIPYKPSVVVAFNQHLFHKAIQIYKDYEHTVYYCQEDEAGFFPFGAEFISARQAIAKSKNIIISTPLLKQHFDSLHLLSKDANVYITSPVIIPWDVKLQKNKKIFFYYRPESFQSRNLAPIIYSAMSDFCQNYTGYEIYLVGTIATHYSYYQNGNSIFILSKLPYEQYVSLITSCDLVVSLNYSAHPGVIAFQTAASGIPTITNTFENRDAVLLKSISENLIPYNPVYDDLFSILQASLDLPKGNKSFQKSIYGDQHKDGIDQFIRNILTSKSDEV